MGVSSQESDDLIDELARYMIQPDGEYRHKWSVGDIVIWDNRCSYHRAAGDYPPHEDRIHWRTSIKEREGAGRRIAAPVPPSWEGGGDGPYRAAVSAAGKLHSTAIPSGS